MSRVHIEGFIVVRRLKVVPLQIKVQFNASSLEEFPGKHWFSSLSPDQLFARRIGLERYLHSLCQDRIIGTSDALKEFLIGVQKVIWCLFSHGMYVRLSV